MSDQERQNVAQVLVQARTIVGEEVGRKISQRTVAKASGISRSTYNTYEHGQLLTEDAFERLCLTYAHNPKIVRALRRAFGSERKPAPSSILIAASRERTIEFRDFVYHWTEQIKADCNAGNIKSASSKAQSLWPVAKQAGLDFKETHEFALQVARALSQAGSHHLALRALGDVTIRRPDIPMAETLRCELELSRAAITNREHSFRGVIAADMYREVADRIQANAEREPTDRWRELWSNVYRSRIQALTDSLGDDGLAYVDMLCHEFRDGLEDPQNEYEDRANRLVLARVFALRSQVDESMEALERLGCDSETAADRALIARAKAISLFRSGDRDEAIWLVEEWIKKSNQMTYKSDTFRLLRNEMMLRMSVRSNKV